MTLTLPFTTPNTARFSPCGAYRYTLTREDLGGSGAVVSIGLNPSTATAEVNDPTITREMGFCPRMYRRKVGRRRTTRCALRERARWFEAQRLTRPSNGPRLRR